MGRKYGPQRTQYANGNVEEAEYFNDMMHGPCIDKYADGQIEKGHMENDKKVGTWEIYYPAEITGTTGFWCKQDFENDENVTDLYEYSYDK